MAKAFKDLTEQEVLALAISLEEEDGRIYADFADDGVQVRQQDGQPAGDVSVRCVHGDVQHCGDTGAVFAVRVFERWAADWDSTAGADVQRDDAAGGGAPV